MMSAQIPHSMTAHSPTGSSTERSPWHSPVPYLFGGLAAMLGLIAFALLILACSYWKLSGFLENDENRNADVELGDADLEEKRKDEQMYDEKILVIMAGQAIPTYLATPATSRTASFGSNYSSSSGKSSDEPEKEGQEKEKEKEKEDNCNQVQTGAEPGIFSRASD